MESPYTCVIPDFEEEEPLLHYLRRSGESRNPDRQLCVYLLASRRNGTLGSLYVGGTSNMAQHIWQQKSRLVEGFTKRYGVHTLAWYEIHTPMESAIERETASAETTREMA